MNPIVEGVFVLDKDITNPNADKRFRARRTATPGTPTHWLKADAWKKGQHFLIKRHWEQDEHFEIFELAPFYGRTYSMDYVRITVRRSSGEVAKMRASDYDDDGEPALRSLFESLVLAPPLDGDDALHFAFKKRGLDPHSAYRVVRGLMKKGLISITDVEKQLDHDDEEEEAAS